MFCYSHYLNRMNCWNNPFIFSPVWAPVSPSFHSYFPPVNNWGYTFPTFSFNNYTSSFLADIQSGFSLASRLSLYTPKFNYSFSNPFNLYSTQSNTEHTDNVNSKHNFDSNNYINFTSSITYNPIEDKKIFKATRSSESLSDDFKKISTNKASVSKNLEGNVSEIRFERTYKQLSNPEKLGPEFLEKTKKVANNIGCDYRDLLAVMNIESIGINSKAEHRTKSGRVTAVGLIQFTDIAVKQLNKDYGLNLSLSKILKMSAIEQLDLVEKYYLSVKRISGFEGKQLSGIDLYAITFLPANAKKEVLTREGETYYEWNPSLDLDKDKKITRTELGKLVASRQVKDSRFV